MKEVRSIQAKDLPHVLIVLSCFQLFALSGIGLRGRKYARSVDRRL